jgi:hypothetical protein
MSTATVGEHLRKRDAGEDAKASRSKAALAMRASSPLHFEKLLHDVIAPEDGRIEKAALYGNEMEEQTEYAYQEIAKILREAGVLVAVHCSDAVAEREARRLERNKLNSKEAM